MSSFFYLLPFDQKSCLVLACTIPVVKQNFLYALQIPYSHTVAHATMQKGKKREQSEPQENETPIFL